MLLARCEKPVQRRNILSVARMPLAAAVLFLFANGCGKQATVSAPPAQTPQSDGEVTARGTAVVMYSAAAECAVAPSGYVAASLVSDGRKLSLDDAAGASGVALTAGGEQMADGG